MANKDKLKQMLTNRNPLLDTKREAVTPVNLYTNPQTDNKEESTQVDKLTSIQTGKNTKQQTVKPVSPQVVKYTTHLKPATIKAVKLLAVETDRKDYEIVEEAIAEYLKRGTPHK